MVTRAYEAALQPSGLKVTQFTLLANLSKRGDLPLTRLAQALVMDRTTLTRNLKPLVARGLVTIEQEDDQRVRRIAITEQGTRVFEEALPHWQEVQARLVERLGYERWSGLIADLAATVSEVQGR